MSRLAAALLLWSLGCWPRYQAGGCAEEKRATCDKGLSRLCSCETIDCSEATVDPTILSLRRCNPSDPMTADLLDLSTCLDRSAQYCVHYDAIARGSGPACDVQCGAAELCDLSAWCAMFQSARCTGPDGGSP